MRLRLPADGKPAVCWLVALFYAVVMALLFHARTVPMTGYETDGVYYMIQSRALLSQDFTPSTYGGGVGMPLATRLVSQLVPDTFDAAKLVSVMASFLFLLASARIAAKLFDASAAEFSLILLALNPLVLVYSTTSLSDALGAALPLLGFWCLLDNSRPWRLFVGGLCLGMGWTTRYLNLVFFPLALVALWPLRSHRARMTKAAASIGLGLALGSIPQAACNWMFFGSPFFTNNWRNVAASVYPWDRVNQLTSFREVIDGAGLRLLVLWLKRLSIDVPELLFHAAYWPIFLAVPGFLLALKNAKQRMPLVAWGATLLLYLALIAPVWRIELRYFLPVLPLLLASAAFMWRAATNARPMVAALGLFLAAAISVAGAAQSVREMIASQSAELRTAGEFIRATAAPGDIVAASQPHVFFYAERRGLMLESLSKQEIDQLPETVKRKHIGWLVFDGVRGVVQYPALAWLLDSHSIEAAQLGWSARFSSDMGRRAVVWRTQ